MFTILELDSHYGIATATGVVVMSNMDNENLEVNLTAHNPMVTSKTLKRLPKEAIKLPAQIGVFVDRRRAAEAAQCLFESKDVHLIGVVQYKVWSHYIEGIARAVPSAYEQSLVAKLNNPIYQDSFRNIAAEDSILNPLTDTAPSLSPNPGSSRNYYTQKTQDSNRKKWRDRGLESLSPDIIKDCWSGGDDRTVVLLINPTVIAKSSSLFREVFIRGETGEMELTNNLLADLYNNCDEVYSLSLLEGGCLSCPKSAQCTNYLLGKSGLQMNFPDYKIPLEVLIKSAQEPSNSGYSVNGVKQVTLSSITTTMHYKEYCKIKMDDLKACMENGGFTYIPPSVTNTESSPFSKIAPENVEISEEVINRNRENRKNILEMSIKASKYKKDNCNKCAVKQGCRGLSGGKVVTSCAGPVKKLPNKVYILPTIKEEINYLSQHREIYNAIVYFSGYQADKDYGAESNVMIAGFVSKKILEAEGARMLKSLRTGTEYQETNYNEMSKVGVVLLRNSALMASAVSGKVYTAYASSRNRRELVFGDYLYNSGIMHNNLVAGENKYPGWYAKILLQTGAYQGNIVYVDMDVALSSIYGKHNSASLRSSEGLLSKASNETLFENTKPYYFYSCGSLLRETTAEVPDKDIDVEAIININGSPIPKTRTTLSEILKTLRDVEIDRDALEKYLLLMASPLRMTKLEGGGFGSVKKIFSTTNAHVRIYPGAGIVSAEPSYNEYRHMDLYSRVNTASSLSKITVTLTQGLPDIRTPNASPSARAGSYKIQDLKGSVKAIDVSKKASAAKFRFLDIPLEDKVVYYDNLDSGQELSLDAYVRVSDKRSSSVFSAVAEDSDKVAYVAAMSLVTEKTIRSIQHFVMGLNSSGELCFRDVNTDEFRVGEFSIGTTIDNIKNSAAISMLAEDRVRTAFGSCEGKERELDTLKAHYANNVSRLLEMVSVVPASNNIAGNIVEKIKVVIYKRPMTLLASVYNKTTSAPMYITNEINIVDPCPNNDSDTTTRNPVYRGSLKMYGFDEGSIYISRLSQAVYSYKTSRYANRQRIESWGVRPIGQNSHTGSMYSMEVFDDIIKDLREDDN